MRLCAWPGCPVACFRRVACPWHLSKLQENHREIVRLYYRECRDGRIGRRERDRLVRRLFRKVALRAENV